MKVFERLKSTNINYHYEETLLPPEFLNLPKQQPQSAPSPVPPPVVHEPFLPPSLPHSQTLSISIPNTPPIGLTLRSSPPHILVHSVTGPAGENGVIVGDVIFSVCGVGLGGGGLEEAVKVIR